METSDSYKLSFDYYLEYAVMEHRSSVSCVYHEPVFVSRDAYEAFRELRAAPDDVQRTLQLLLKDPEGKTLYYRVLAKYGKGLLWQ